MRDLRYSLRILSRYPRYTVLAVLTLASGIGVVAAMFGLVDALFFRPLPIVDQDRLVDVSLVSPTNRFASFSYQEFLDIERDAPGFKDVMAIGRRGVTLHHNGEVRSLRIHYVSGRYFPSLGIPMHGGRGFGQADDRPDVTTPQVVINHLVWQELGAPADIIGRSIRLNNTMFTVIGVTARGFAGLNRPMRTDVWVTIAQAPFVVPGLRGEITDRGQRWFQIVGRLADGATADQARAGLEVLMARWRAADARAYADARIDVGAQDASRQRQIRVGSIFLAVVGLVLLIACANVANLTLARGEERHREMAVRTAIGATRASLLRQMLMESVLLSIAAAIAGVGIAAWLTRSFPALLPPGASAVMVLDIRLDARFLAFTVILALLTTTLVGLVPAVRTSRTDINTALKRRGPGSTWSGRGVQLRDILVVTEIALAGAVVIAAALVVRSLLASLAVNPGFEMRKNVATFYVVPALSGYDNAATYRFLETARQAAATLPGVRRVSYGIRLPGQSNEAGWSASVRVAGREPPPGRDAFDIRYTMVGPGYFEVMGTRLLSGRGIGEGDLPHTQPVAVISETMAQRLWPGENPIGRRLRMGRARPVEREIVGIAEDIRIGGLYEPPEMYVYVPYAQQQQGFGLLLVEAEADAALPVAEVRRQIAELDARVAVLTVSSFADHRAQLLYDDRRNAWIGIAVGLLALTLGAVGVYGVVSLVTARRTKEIGIRLALGAERRRLVRLLLGRGAALAVVGTAAGIAGGLAVGRLLRDQLHGVSAADPWSIVFGTVILGGVAIAASVVPAWRASGVDPALALRDD